MNLFKFVVRMFVFRSELISPDSNSNSVILAFSFLMGSKLRTGCDLKGGDVSVDVTGLFTAEFNALQD